MKKIQKVYFLQLLIAKLLLLTKKLAITLQMKDDLNLKEIICTYTL